MGNCESRFRSAPSPAFRSCSLRRSRCGRSTRTSPTGFPTKASSRKIGSGYRASNDARSTAKASNRKKDSVFGPMLARRSRPALFGPRSARSRNRQPGPGWPVPKACIRGRQPVWIRRCPFTLSARTLAFASRQKLKPLPDDHDCCSTGPRTQGTRP